LGWQFLTTSQSVLLGLSQLAQTNPIFMNIFAAGGWVTAAPLKTLQ